MTAGEDEGHRGGGVQGGARGGGPQRDQAPARRPARAPVCMNGALPAGCTPRTCVRANVSLSTPTHACTHVSQRDSGDCNDRSKTQELK